MTLLDNLSHIRLFAFDLDGVLTNGKLLILPGGEWVREMDIKDGYALEKAVLSGFSIAVISGSSSAPVRDRLKKLGIGLFFEHVTSKSQVLKKIMHDHSLTRQQVLFMGDDIPDLDVYDHVGVFACPADAVPEIRTRSHFISTRTGGNGCVREVIEKTLKVQGKWTS